VTGPAIEPVIALVIAVADNGIIGRNGALPWHLPDDLKHFKALTLGKPVLMGRRTYESLGRPLSGRRNLVLTRAANPDWAGVEAVGSLDEALSRTQAAAELCVIGGAGLYTLALPRAQRIHLTRVHASPDGDTSFPLETLADWQEIERDEHASDARHAHAMSFITLRRADRRSVDPRA
jgi:dihydrofolate reductase